MSSTADLAAAAPAAEEPLDALVRFSRRVGADPSLVLRGGGNTSLKTDETDVLGRPLRVLRVKGSGSDLASIRRSDFAGVRLDDVLPLFGREDMSDEEMVAYLARCLTDPASPRPSIETLLHAFIPAASVFHSHADALLALVNTPTRAAAGRRPGRRRAPRPLPPPRLPAFARGGRGGARPPRRPRAGAPQPRPGHLGRHPGGGVRAAPGAGRRGRASTWRRARRTGCSSRTRGCAWTTGSGGARPPRWRR